MRQFEQKLIDLYVAPAKRERVSLLLSKPKGRLRGIHEFHTSSVFDEGCLVEIPGRDQSVDSIFRALQKLGAGTECYAVSLDDDLDGRIHSLPGALEEVVGSLCETVLFCPDGPVGYFEGGHAKDRYILMVPSHAA